MSSAPTHHFAWFRVAASLAIVVLAALILVDLIDRHRSSSTTGLKGSGVAATESRSLAPFTSLDLAGSNNVAVRVGGAQSVAVHADDNLLTYVHTTVQNGKLVITTTGTFSTVSPMSVEITVPKLAAISLSGSGNISVDGVDVPSLTVQLPGSGNVEVSGSADRLEASVSGSGNEALTGLQAGDAHAVVSGSGNIFTTVTGTLDALVSGSGTIVYSGGPSVTQRVTGSGAIIPG